ncbi:hypothetical protein SBRY_40001 [Actinacidiphila bryophytorum]|uniref:Uncharacterized protein n=1 Tax=Actinacidiphila bryophytorum TaxID=1436133 RepID=A0A9W4H242_9ACTN|nr:hypothetical protein SBRY_40001 [Actinacidiphila bryophytorum]
MQLAREAGARVIATGRARDRDTALGLGRVLEVPPAPRRLARTLAALSESSE